MNTAARKGFNFAIKSSKKVVAAPPGSQGTAGDLTKLAGIYLHIPFCKQACNYCNFHFSTSLAHKDELLRALIKEAEAENVYLQGETIDTVYFGGGTPSLLSTAETGQIFSALRSSYPISPEAEITFEANPDDITPEKISGWKELGINRVSIGTQSFFEEELRWMNRAHDAEQAVRSIEWLQSGGIDNISIDLIYGSPLLTDEGWEENVRTAISLGIPHLSCYALTVEDKTPLHKSIRAGQTTEVDPDKAARQFLLLMEWMRKYGYQHYEVSNFSLPGRHSRHNSSYWSGHSYLGLGPSAHSFNGAERRWNVANNTRYARGIFQGIPLRESETLTPLQQLNETIMISLRTRNGLDFQLLENKWPLESTAIRAGIQKFVDDHKVVWNEGRAVLTDEGMLHADGIASDLFQ